ATVAKLEAERDSATAAFNFEHAASLLVEETTVRLGAEVDRMRPVVDALPKLEHEIMWVVGEIRSLIEQVIPARPMTLKRWEQTLTAPLLAVDAMRAAQKAPGTAPEATPPGTQHLVGGFIPNKEFSVPLTDDDDEPVEDAQAPVDWWTPLVRDTAIQMARV